MTDNSSNAGSIASATPVAPSKMQDAKMPEATQQTATTGDKALLKEIHVKWNKFSEQDVTNLKDNDDLVTQLVAKYGLAKDVAQRDADTLRAGRNI